MEFPLGGLLFYLIQNSFSKRRQKDGFSLEFLVGSDDAIRLSLNLKEAIQLFFQHFKRYFTCDGRALIQESPLHQLDRSFDDGKGRDQFMREVVERNRLGSVEPLKFFP
jgi:hypothetical protein